MRREKRAEAIALEEALRLLKRDTLVPPPDDLAERSMAAALRAHAQASRIPRARRLFEAFFRPRELRFRLVPASVATIVLAASALALLVPTRREPSDADDALPSSTSSSFEERALRLVPLRFVLPNTGASSVAVAGDFNDWDPSRTLLEDIEGNGVFVGTVWVPPGTYDYMFVIDGRTWVTDPYASSFRDDGFGNRNAVVRLD